MHALLYEKLVHTGNFVKKMFVVTMHFILSDSNTYGRNNT